MELVSAASLDPESARWLRALTAAGRGRDDAHRRLHELLVRVARAETYRRAARSPVTGVELDDLAHQAAADAMVAILAKLARFRGESRFTTWAYRFVMIEVSTKLGRHFWRHPSVSLDADSWERLPDRFGLQPERESEWRDLLDALRRAVDRELTERQRAVFVAIVLDGVPLDALVIQLNSNRNAIYKTMFDARRKLRAALVADGQLTDEERGEA
ncbi:sigma-70 family RNA polymerase sigma factor [Micromonospora sp. NPDC000089]|uniref:sigma-70 family RNA polymerase sigma factor n=1 Tax=unclassified Micromonospora TaxID=2617518 RepID=UPI0036A6DC32